MKNSVSVFHYDSLDSTQEEAARLVEKGVEAPFLVVSREQTAGRGRLGRTFYSPKDTGLYMTAVLPLPAVSGVAVTCLTAVRVVKALEKVGAPKLWIKWVNDLMLQDRKIAGILTEKKSGKLFVGIGINLSVKEFPEEIREKAGNLAENGRLSREDAEKLSAAVGEALLSLGSIPGNDSELQFYRERSYLTGKKVHCLPLDVTGIVTGIDDFGGLVLETKDGEKVITSGEVTVRTV